MFHRCDAMLGNLLAIIRTPPAKQNAAMNLGVQRLDAAAASISGQPVRSATSRTLTPASRNNFAVPPVETISTPARARDCANSTRPVLSNTLISARSIATNASTQKMTRRKSSLLYRAEEKRGNRKAEQEKCFAGRQLQTVKRKFQRGYLPTFALLAHPRLYGSAARAYTHGVGALQVLMRGPTAPTWTSGLDASSEASLAAF